MTMMFDDVKACIAWIEGLKRQKQSKDLEDFKRLCAYFGNPEDYYKTIHVAGTNGKGSVVAYFASILSKASYNIGTFTSPYIECFNERIQYNHNYIPDKYILKYANLIISKFDDLEKLNIPRPSFFAFITLMAFMYFKEMKVDVAIIEVGIGGLLDNTNVIKPVLCAISNVSYDHMEILGNTIEEIAGQKLGIVKDNVPLVSIENENINDLLYDTCKVHKSPFTLVKRKNIKDLIISLGETKFSYLDYQDIELKMNGKYQAENACVVIEGIRYLNILGFRITKENVITGLKDTKWLGRLEIVNDNPLIILDGAHNVNGVSGLMDYIKDIKKDNYVRLIVAISSNKDKEAMLDMMSDELIDELVLTSFNYTRSDTAINLYNLSNHKSKIIKEDIDEIINDVINNKSYVGLDYASHKVINIFSGSLYFVSEVRKKIM